MRRFINATIYIDKDELRRKNQRDFCKNLP